MNRKLTISTAVALGAAFALAPIAGQAAMAAPVSSQTVQAQQAASAVSGFSEKKTTGANKNFADVTLNFSRATSYKVIDDRGDVVANGFGAPGRFNFFEAEINGEASRDYTAITTTNGVEDAPYAFTVDLTGLRIASPVDQTSVREIGVLKAAVQAGQNGQGIRYKGLPGAEITVIANGQTHTSRTLDNGEAFVSVYLEAGKDNRIEVFQTLNGQESNHDTYGYIF